MKPPHLMLANGRTIPQIGLGLWKVRNKNDFDRAFDAAIKHGYRHFDDAEAYGNEQWLGAAIRRHNLPREELYITTKIATQHFGYRHALHAFDESLSKLQTDYVDLLLLHFPLPILRKGTWRALEELCAAGKAKSIGVSNYTIRHLESMKSYAKVLPVINQVELHVFLQQPALLQYCREHDITVEAYSPLAHATAMSNSTIQHIAENHKKSYAQIMLRWGVQNGLVVLPKSVTPHRIAENIAIFDFELSNEEMLQIEKEDRNLRTCLATSPADWLP